ncbi:MAG TPA: hypothetical protein VNP93_05685 [Gaiellaceae bacterium]|nr:hypothetical protein [Gaiellaceae bacterium]
MDRPQPPEDTLRTIAFTVALGTTGGAVVLLVLSPWWGGSHAVVHAAGAFVAAVLGLLAAVRWGLPQNPPERLARLLLVGSFVLVAVAQLIEGIGALGLDAAHDAGAALGRVAFPLVLIAIVAALAIGLAKSRQGGASGRW